MTNKEFFIKAYNDIISLHAVRIYASNNKKESIIYQSITDSIKYIRMVFAFKFWNIIAWEFNTKENPVLDVDISLYLADQDSYQSSYDKNIVISKCDDGFYYDIFNFKKHSSPFCIGYDYPEFAMVASSITAANAWDKECISQYDHDGDRSCL